MFPANHKTVFVLDHTPYFSVSSESPIELDTTKSRPSGYIPLPPICKSLWTCSVEAAVEYCRIVWDLYPDGKLITFIVSDTSAQILNRWNSSNQNLTHILNAMSTVGVPFRRNVGGSSGTFDGTDPSVVLGLRAAVDILGDCTAQQEALISREQHVINRGRIVCLTSARDDASLRSLADITVAAIMAQNKRTDSLSIQHCHLVLINLVPENSEVQVHNQSLLEISPLLAYEVEVTKASRTATLLGRLVLPHYGLTTTTVTGIPMKEEQNASSSANYDVEIVHAAEAHVGVRTGVTAAGSVIPETVTLRWSTPRGGEANAGGAANAGPLWRVTPVDVASRPSACLVNFLLNGRSVTLEAIRRGTRSASHALAAQGGEIFIQALAPTRGPLDDPPSVSEGPGGRVTDYRIKDFGALMKQNRLKPLRGTGSLARARARLARHTLYWPLTLSSTLLLNLGGTVEPLPRLVVQESLSEDEVALCRGVLCALLGLEARHEPLGVRCKPRLTAPDQWRQLWGELEALVRAHANSPGHRALLRCLLECRATAPTSTLSALSHGGNGNDSQRASVIRNAAIMDSPMSPPSAGNDAVDVFAPRGVLENLLGGSSSIRVIKRADFAGRMAAGSGPAVLYPNFTPPEPPQSLPQTETEA